MADLENIYYHIERAALDSAEIAMLIARCSDRSSRDKMVDMQILADLAAIDLFFVNLSLDEFSNALSNYDKIKYPIKA